MLRSLWKGIPICALVAGTGASGAFAGTVKILNCMTMAVTINAFNSNDTVHIVPSGSGYMRTYETTTVTCATAKCQLAFPGYSVPKATYSGKVIVYNGGYYQIPTTYKIECGGHDSKFIKN